MQTTPEVNKYFSQLAKLTHKKKPRSKEFYRKMQEKSVAKRRANKELSIE